MNRNLFINGFFNARAVFVSVAVMFLFTGTVSAENKIAVIIKLKGAVNLKLPEKDVWIEAEKGAILQSGSQLKTEEDGLAMIKFIKDGSMMRLKPGTEIRLVDKADKDREKSQGAGISLGSVLFNVKEQSAEEGFIVKTPTSVATVKGTRFHVTVKNDSTTLVVCEKGSVSITNLFSGKEETINPGYTAVSDRSDVTVRNTAAGDTGPGSRDQLLEINFIDKDNNSKKLLIELEDTDIGK